MFRRNDQHLQWPLLSDLDALPPKLKARLEASWAGTFYREVFVRIDEKPFAVLYSDEASRPNIPINVLVGLETLKAGFGWSDEEMDENFCFDLQVRRALGYWQLGEGHFELRTMYNFRQRLSNHMQRTGEDLVAQAFAQVTDEQVVAFSLKTSKLRMDSTQIASNIVSASRLQLLVEGLQRVERILSETDKARLADEFAPYTCDSSGHYTYRVKGKQAVQEHLQKIGQVIYTRLHELKGAYASKAPYQVLERLFAENFHLMGSQIHPKENDQLTSSCLQSVDDLEASYRTKGNASYKGYVANLTETCDPENKIQLITKVQVAPNNVDDGQLLAEALPHLKERSGVDTLLTDGGYGGQVSDTALQEQQVQLIQTAMRGRSPDPEKVHLSQFTIKFNAEGKPSKVTCPQGQIVPAQTSSHQKAFVAHFDPHTCQTCPYLDLCPAKPGKRDGRHHLRFTQAEARSAERRRQSQAHAQDSQNLRAAVEATVRSLKHPFPAGKLPVRGKFRMTCMIIASAAMTNVRRIQRFTAAKTKPQQAKSGGQARSQVAQDSFFAFAWHSISPWLRPNQVFGSIVGC